MIDLNPKDFFLSRISLFLGNKMNENFTLVVVKVTMLFNNCAQEKPYTILQKGLETSL